ncbi:MAG: lipopolysaccharide core heptose(I) kinase RfaP [Arenicellales bacterium]|nr:lipopolysaccharide core heptose(I) kinase RfaP [Arenicellales bacterium]
MRLAFCLFRYFPFSGLARDMLRIADAAKDRGHEVHIFTSAWQGEITPQHKLKVIPVSGISNHRRAFNFHRALQGEIKDSRFDRVVGFNKIPGLDVYYAADPCFASRIRYTRHPLYRLTPRYKMYHRLEQAVFGQGVGTRNLVLSERAKSEYQEFYGSEDSRFTVLPPSLGPEYQNLTNDTSVKRRVRNELGIQDDDLIVLMVGSGFKTKGVDRAILSLAALPAKLRGMTHLVVAGEGRPEPFINLVKQNGIEQQIHFIGGRNDVPDLLGAATLLVHPAYNENTGTVLLESMAAGLPVLTTDVCGYAHHVSKAGAGCVLQSPFNQHRLNATLEQMLGSDIAEWAQNGQQYVKQPLFSTMPARAVEVIEQPPPGLDSRAKQSKEFLYLAEELQLASKKHMSFEDIMALPGKIFREEPGRRTLRIRQQESGYFLKVHYGVGWREIFKNLFNLKLPVLGADNEWHALHFLGRKGIKAPAPLGFGRKGRNPAKRRSFVIMEEITGATSLEALVKHKNGCVDDLKLKRKLIYGLANISRTLHNNGVNHRDFYLCHFLIDDRFIKSAHLPEMEDVPIVVIDLHRAQLRRKTPTRWIVKDLAGLYYSSMDTSITRNDIFRFIKTYCGLPLRAALNGPVNWDRVQWRAFMLHRSESTAKT